MPRVKCHSEQPILPDMIGASVILLMARVDALEKIVMGREPVSLSLPSLFIRFPVLPWFRWLSSRVRLSHAP